MNSLKNIELRNGVFTTLGLISFFFLMRAMGLVEIIELRVLNIFIMGAGVYLTVRRVRLDDEHFNYLKGIWSGLVVAGLSALMFSVFIFFYLRLIDPAFMESLIQTEHFGEYLNPYSVATTIFIEAAFSGFFLSYASMQYLKKRAIKTSVLF